MSIDAKHSYRFGFLKSEEWTGHRKIILSERKARCAVCGVVNWGNDVHHIVYRKGLKLNRRSDFQVLCRVCHQVVHFVMEHREKIGAKGKGINHGWKNIKRSAKRIVRVALVCGMDAALVRATAIYAEILANRIENSCGRGNNAKTSALASQTDTVRFTTFVTGGDSSL